MTITHFYSTLLRLYPADYKARFAGEMRCAFEQAAIERGGRNRAAWSRFVFSEFAGLVAGAGVEWIAKLTTGSAVRGRSLPDLRIMRPAGVSREDWFADFPDEQAAAERRVRLALEGMVHAIAHHQFEQASRFSAEEIEAREALRLLGKQAGPAQKQ